MAPCWEGVGVGRVGRVGEGGKEDVDAAVLSAGGAQHRGGLGVVVAGCNVVGRGRGEKGVAVGIGGAVEA